MDKLVLLCIVGATLLVIASQVLSWLAITRPIRHCQHLSVHRIYGDAIIARGWRQWVCDNCGKPLEVPPTWSIKKP